MATREERLAALQSAVVEWADSEEQRLRDEASFLRSVLSGRTNGGQLSSYITAEASELVFDEINAYLVE